MNPDFLIIGGGVIGLATAFRLAADGAQVCIVERGASGAEASWAGAGILAPLLPWQYPAVVTDLCQRGAALYPDWIAAIEAASGIAAQYWRCGMLILPPFDATAAQIWCTRHQWPFETVSAADYLAEANPALWLADVAQVRNPRLIKSLRAAVVARGVKLLEHTEVTALSLAGRQVRNISTRSGKLSAHAYITCAGAWSQQLLANHPPAKTIKPMRGQILLFRTDPDYLRHIIYQQGIYIVPRADGHILVGSTLEDVGFDKSTTTDARQMLIDTAFRLLPKLQTATLLRHWSGLRPGSPDNIPTIARHPVIDNLYLNAGHFRYGVTMAPVSATLIADLVLGKVPELDMAAYRWGD